MSDQHGNISGGCLNNLEPLTAAAWTTLTFWWQLPEQHWYIGGSWMNTIEKLATSMNDKDALAAAGWTTLKFSWQLPEQHWSIGGRCLNNMDICIGGSCLSLNSYAVAAWTWFHWRQMPEQHGKVGGSCLDNMVRLAHIDAHLFLPSRHGYQKPCCRCDRTDRQKIQGYVRQWGMRSVI